MAILNWVFLAAALVSYCGHIAILLYLAMLSHRLPNPKLEKFAKRLSVFSACTAVAALGAQLMIVLAFNHLIEISRALRIYQSASWGLVSAMTLLELGYILLLVSMGRRLREQLLLLEPSVNDSGAAIGN